MLLLALLVFPAALLLRGSGTGEGDEGKGCCSGGGGHGCGGTRPSRRGVLQDRWSLPVPRLAFVRRVAAAAVPPPEQGVGGRLGPSRAAERAFPAPATSSALLASGGNAASWGAGRVGFVRAKGACSSPLPCSAIRVEVVYYLWA